MFEPYRTTPGASRRGRSWTHQALDARQSAFRWPVAGLARNSLGERAAMNALAGPCYLRIESLRAFRVAGPGAKAVDCYTGARDK